MKSIENNYKHYCSIPSDIHEHLPNLKRYASLSESIVELGVRDAVSTWAFLAGNPDRLLSVDIFRSPNIDHVVEACQHRPELFEFWQKSSLEIIIPQCDLLFIDTFHNFNQLSKELKLHHDNVNKWIILHDTTTYAHHSEPNSSMNSLEDFGNPNLGLWDAVSQFLIDHPAWTVKERFTNNNGLTILHKA
jgi:hypothetical protein